MKLLFCPSCCDVRRLPDHTKEWAFCWCRKSWGRYDDESKATIGGEAIPLGIANRSFAQALAARKASGGVESFTAFVIERECPTVEVAS